MRVLDRSSALRLLLHGPPRPRDERPVRTPDFFARFFDADAGTDSLTCRECKHAATYDHADVPPVGALINCSNCGLPSRVPVAG